MNWSQSFFSMLYYELFMARSPEKLAHEVAVIKTLAGVGKSDSVVDFCCGVGNLLAEFQKQGHATAGVEWSTDYVKHAKTILNQSDVVGGDAITHAFGKTFDVALNWYSSFGYFNEDANLQLLKNMRQHVRPGGKAVVEVFNSYDVIKNFTPHMEYTKTHGGKSYRIQRDSSIDMTARRLVQRWTIRGDDDTERIYDTSNTLYFADEIAERMARAGFSNVQSYERPLEGEAIEKRPPRMQSKRLIFVGQMA